MDNYPKPEKRAMERIVQKKSFQFAVRIVKLCKYLREEQNELF